jgi:hypothetical protein
MEGCGIGTQGHEEYETRRPLAKARRFRDSATARSGPPRQKRIRCQRVNPPITLIRLWSTAIQVDIVRHGR